jgi:AcrR family transcriptional regulator
VSIAATRPGGRRAGATREQVLAAARERYLGGRRIDVLALAGELGVGRATLYRWFGSREGLIGEVIATEAERLFESARARAGGSGSAALIETFDRINRALARSTALRSFLENERDTALRILTTSGGPVQPRAVAGVAALIEREAEAGDYRPPVDPSTLAYAIVRLAEAFIYNDTVVGIRGDVERLREVQAVLLGLA